MKITGVIAEYNPLHNGHVYHFNNIKSDLKILVMSSSFTMRGDLSLFNKFEKTKQALELGYDLVIELPFVYTLQRADIYAKNNIDILNLCNIDEIVIGSEENDVNKYEKYYKDATQLENASPYSYEEVYSFNPELILVNERMSASNIADLSKICPVIPLLTDSTDFDSRLKYIGNIFGLQESAKTLSEYAENLKTDMLNDLKDLKLGNKTLTIYTYMGGVSIVPERGFFMNTILFDYLGVNRLDKVKEFMQNESQLAYEPIADSNIKDYEGDLVFFAATGGKTISTFVTEKPGWKKLKAVQENRVGVIDMDTFAQKGVLLLYDQYSQILDAFKVALKA